jgi:peptidoglycan/xylan/chitin deacetylase (PgdA/CDA1 family)
MASRARRSEHRGIAAGRVGRWLRGHGRLALTGLSVLVAASGIVVPALPATAATGTTVALTFDNNTLSQYALGFQQALQPHGVNATFYVSSGSVSNSSSTKYMSWSQLSALSAAGNDIGGKTVDGTSLTTLTTQQQISEICTDRQNLAQHGLKPDTFAYPGGAFNTTIEAEVQSCGYGNARTAGSLSPTGSLYAETLPPKTWLALRAYAPTGQISLANLEAVVSGAAAHGGGWVPIVIGKVCSQTQDPTNYSTCTASSGWIDLGDLNAFLSWVQSAGQSGGAPTGTAFNTMQGTAISTDTVPPTTAIFCGGSPCASTAYTSTVSVSLAATDFGAGVASTHYTTDGTTPTLTSPAYTGAFPLTSTTTVQFRSWDAAGNAEAAKSQTIPIQEPPDSTPPATTIYCNGGPCSSAGYTAPVTVALSATDNTGGWGVANTYYTTDGSTPTTSSTVYTGPFTVKKNSTVNFFSTDLAGNAEQVNSQAIPFTVVVSLTFDDGIENQYTLGFLRALQPHHVIGTFFINTGNTDRADSAMTWSQLVTLNDAGNEIGGHTLDEYNIKGCTDQATCTSEVCQDHQNLVNHGFYPVSFAYPFGAYDANAESIVKGCGYTDGRAAGGIDVGGVGAGPIFAETLPPKDVLATRTIYNAPAGSPPNVPPLSLSDMQSAITAASQNGGGWVQLTFHEVCSQTFDPSDYSSCIGDWGPVELSTLNSLLDWLQNVGQQGGAPAGTVMKTVSQVINGPDTQAPITTVECDGTPCGTTAYNGSTTVSIFPKDPGGSGVKATYYTTDGSTPTTASPVWNYQPFTINSNMTFKFFSVDNAGNSEAVQTQTVRVQPNLDPVIGSAGDIACDPTAAAFNNGLGFGGDCVAAATASLLTGVDAVLPLGDDQYNCGGLGAFEQSYGPTWGVKKSITYPVPGDKDYTTSGGTDCPTTAGLGYQQYFSGSGGLLGSAVPSVVNANASTAYYSYNLGSWHIIALNTAPCVLNDPLFCAAGSAQDVWLQNDLAHDTATCTLAYYQNPRWASTASGSGGDSTMQELWLDLYNGGADVVMNGDSHWYERFTPMNASGASDNAHGVREFIVGTGGAGLEPPGTEVSTSQVLNATTHGIIKLTLHNGSYAWQFVNDGESSFTDSGTGTCHAKP